ncbi:PHO80 [Sanghuangporus sanghuang]
MESPGKIELPRAFEHADIDHLVVLIADMLDRLIEHNDKIPLSPEALTRFHSRTPPTISVLDYLRRIVKYANVERTCLLITLHYIDQICARLPHFTLSSLTCHRFIITAVVVASKALCDAFCTNAHYAKVGGIRIGELNVLEKELLNAIDWRLTSTREVLDAYYVNLIRTHSSGAYTLAAETTSPALTDVDSDMDSLLSASPSPTFVSAILEEEKQMQAQATVANGILNAPNGVIGGRLSAEPQAIEPSTVLIDRATLSPKPCTGPTLEQNMAFEALRQASSSSATARTCSSAPVATATSMNTSITNAGASSLPQSTSGPLAPASERNGSLPRSFPSSPHSHLHLHKPMNQSTLSPSSSALTPSELSQPPPPSTSPPTASPAPLSAHARTRGTRSPNKRSVEHAYASGYANTYAYTYAHAHARISNKNPSPDQTSDQRSPSSQVSFRNVTENENENENENEGAPGVAYTNDNSFTGRKVGDTLVDVDIDVDSMRPRTRLRIDYEGQGVG